LIPPIFSDTIVHLKERPQLYFFGGNWSLNMKIYWKSSGFDIANNIFKGDLVIIW